VHDFISVSSTNLYGDERRYVNDCLDRGWLSQGYYVKRFEEEFANYIGTRHAISCASGTAALHLSMLALGIGVNDAVIVPALTYVATANAARYCGAPVFFADIEPDSWCMDANYTPTLTDTYEKIVAVPVHLYDSVATIPITDMPVIEDACHALGAYSGSYASTDKVGTIGDLACFSFYASKHISCGEGGMVTTNSDELAEKIKLYRGQGASTTQGKNYHHVVIGYNYRMTDLQAALGLAQLEKLDESIEYRRDVVDYYRSKLRYNPKIWFQDGPRSSGWMFAVLLDKELDRDRVAQELLQANIETRPFFEPLPSLPMYRTGDVNPSSLFPITYDIASRGLCLPTHCNIDHKDIDYICSNLERIVGGVLEG
jgi:perosamine synthetase